MLELGIAYLVGMMVGGYLGWAITLWWQERRQRPDEGGEGPPPPPPQDWDPRKGWRYVYVHGEAVDLW